MPNCFAASNYNALAKDSLWISATYHQFFRWKVGNMLRLSQQKSCRIVPKLTGMLGPT